MPAAIGETVAVLLAAGLSRRYGPEDKLLAPLRGRALIAHAADVLGGLAFAARIAVVGATDGPVAEVLAERFDLVLNPAPERGQDSSIRLGLQAALDRGARHVLICLGDMPNVTAAHIGAMLKAADAGTTVLSTAGEAPSPPTLLPRVVAAAVLDETKAPIREIVRSGRATRIAADPEILRDFDEPADWR